MSNNKDKYIEPSNSKILNENSYGNDSEENFHLLPAGEYKVELQSIYEHVSPNGHIIIYLNWKIISGEYSGIAFMTSIFKNQSESMSLFRKAIKAMGHKMPKDSDYRHMQGSKCMVLIAHGKGQFYKGNNYRKLV